MEALVRETEASAVHAALPAAVARQQGTVAVIPVTGIMFQRPSFFGSLFGAVGTDQIAASVRSAAADSGVKAIVLDVDSPGGETFGVPELADAVYTARGVKPVVAVANSLDASAAYWISSQATEVVASPSSMLGSIGVFALHEDISQLAEAAGVKVTLISAGKYKTEGNEFEPLSDEARGAVQQMVDDTYSMFVAAVARGRGVKPHDVRTGMGEGRLVLARDAVRLGMADRIGTLGDVLARLGAGAAPMSARTPMDGLAAKATPPHTSPAIAQDDEPWDAAAVVANLPDDHRKWLGIFAWYDETADDEDEDGLPDAKGAWKLPHHNERGTLVPRGLFAAAQRLGSADIPSGDVPGVKRHLARHYQELDRTPPWEAARARADRAIRLAEAIA